MKRVTLSLGLVLLVTLLAPAAVASADPGDEKVYGEIRVDVRSQLGPHKTRISPSSDYNSNLGGGVSAVSSTAMQYGSSWLGEDVRGWARSYATAPIQEIHVHAALVQHGDSNAQNCYEGSVVWDGPDVTQYSDDEVISGWSPWYSGFHDCWVVASGHYYIHNGVRTDVNEQNDIIRRF